MTGQSQQQVAQQQAGGGSASSGGTALLPHPPATYMQQFYAQQALAAELRKFWAQMMQDVEEHSEALVDFKNQALPLARIKKIMKSDEDVRMISAEAPVLFARSCEYFIQELTIRSWSAAQEFKRRTLQRSDVATAISRTDIFDFLVDIVPREEANEQPGRDGAAAGLPLGATPSLQLGQAPPLPPLAMYSPGPQPGQQQQFVPPPGGQQFMPPPQQGGPGGGPTMLSYNLPPFIAPPLFSFPLGGPSQQPGPGQLLPGMQFPPPQ